ncbi:unnamed protein product [Linum tenue]|nr:unnamed protein product [Linum tenue]
MPRIITATAITILPRLHLLNSGCKSPRRRKVVWKGGKREKVSALGYAGLKITGLLSLHCLERGAALLCETSLAHYHPTLGTRSAQAFAKPSWPNSKLGAGRPEVDSPSPAFEAGPMSHYFGASTWLTSSRYQARRQFSFSTNY